MLKFQFFCGDDEDVSTVNSGDNDGASDHDGDISKLASIMMKYQGPILKVILEQN